MNERLVQFIWQFQYFNRHKLFTTHNERVAIEKPGAWNHHQGPDFSEAVINIAGTKWVGNVEVHIRSSDWHRHRHDNDARYANIILHVVWEDDAPVIDPYGQQVATLVLQPLVPKLLLDRYLQMMETMTAIPCQSFLPVLSGLAWSAWKERLAAERLQRRANEILAMLRESGGHWEEVCWWLIAGNFGMKVNFTLFGMMARSIPWTVICKHRNQPIQLEALLLGQANLLSTKMEDNYSLLLQREFRFLKKKYQLVTIQKQPAFLRMRPAAFPTLRLAQLAMFLHRTENLFAHVVESAGTGAMTEWFCVTANDYWHYHYRLGETTAFSPKQVGRQLAENILINSIAPLLFACGLYHRNELMKEKAVRWLYELQAEQNQITRQWQRSGVPNRCALDSQALIELTNHYCTHKRCLDCAVGNRILKNDVL